MLRESHGYNRQASSSEVLNPTACHRLRQVGKKTEQRVYTLSLLHMACVNDPFRTPPHMPPSESQIMLTTFKTEAGLLLM
ncbi:unnamed protein product [Musa acuminata subsp. burmannicoides]